ncbi:hypothetical protein CEXT_662561 [Caerostris extrusa]|uniref:Uncharacterized protein n=1 Tax=Caerostris extrusa TaxID=172846 RepID=A0AAV4VCJ3_CAEEX|nr:hypothetical protein CEXT_662561 [Caerostris extrusa]
MSIEYTITPAFIVASSAEPSLQNMCINIMPSLHDTNGMMADYQGLSHPTGVMEWPPSFWTRDPPSVGFSPNGF